MKDCKVLVSQSFDDRVTVAAGHNKDSAVYRFEPSLPKPCIHPLTTPAGHRISGFEMSDHVWHRGLWFTIKFINGTNFWEEHAPFGVQQSISQPACQVLSDSQVQISHALEWTSEATGPVIRENRTITYEAYNSGLRSVDWETELHATTDLLLDRTPYTTWGGYGGFSFRGSRELHDASFMLPDGQTATGLAGQPHDWVILNAAVDGGAGQRVSLGMIDHPSNPRSPSPWYCKTGNGFTYLNAAILFHEPMTVNKGQTLKFRYRAYYRDGVWNAAEFQALAEEFRASENGK